MHRVVKGCAAGGHFEANRARRARCFELTHAIGGKPETRAIVLPRFAALFGELSFLTEPIGRAEARVRMSRLDELVSGGSVSIESLRLKVRRVRSSDFGAFIPRQAQPSQAVEDASDHVGR